MREIEYATSVWGMGDLLMKNGVSLKEDFTERERERLRKNLEKYMIRADGKKLYINLKKFVLIIQGEDEASYLYQYLL